MDPWQLLIFFFLFGLSAFFSGSEIALISLGEHSIQALSKQKKKWSKSLLAIKQKNQELLTTILIGNNLVNIFTASLATKIALDLGSNLGLEASLTLALSTGIITFLTLFFGEIVPKTFASRHAEFISLKIAPIYKMLMLFFSPIIFMVIRSTRPFIKEEETVKAMTDEEVESFIDMGKKSGALEPDEHEKIKNILEFDEITAEEIMTPRVKIEAIDAEITITEAIKIALSYSHSKLPVYKENVDTIIGVISLRDLLAHSGDQEEIVEKITHKKILRIPTNQPIDVLFENFQKTRKHIAIVMDEYGWVSGLITIEDVIEEVFGDIKDETDKEPSNIIKKGEGNFIIDASILFFELMEELGYEDEDFQSQYTEFDGETTSYFITHAFERFPKKWENFSIQLENNSKKNNPHDKIIFIILEASESQITSIQVKNK